MPQLMPLYWIFSFFMVIWMVMVSLLIFDSLSMKSGDLKNNSKIMLNWKW